MDEKLEKYEQLTAYLDGELSEAERAEVQRLLEHDPAARALLDDLRAAARLVGSLPRERSTVEMSDMIRSRLGRGSHLGAVGGVSSPPHGAIRWVRGVAVAASIALACTAAYLGMVRLQEYRERRVFTVADNEPVSAKREVAVSPQAAKIETVTKSESPARLDERVAMQSSADGSAAAPGADGRMQTQAIDRSARGGESAENRTERRLIAPAARELKQAAPEAGKIEAARTAPIYGEAADENEVEEMPDSAGEALGVAVIVDAKLKAEMMSKVQSLLASAQVPESVQPSTNLQRSNRRWYRRESSSQSSLINSVAEESGRKYEQTVFTLNVEPQLAQKIITSIGSGALQRMGKWQVGGRSVAGGDEAWAVLDGELKRQKETAEAVAMNASATAGTSAAPATKSSPRMRAATSSPSAYPSLGKSKDVPTDKRELVRIQLRIEAPQPGTTTQGAGGG